MWRHKDRRRRRGVRLLLEQLEDRTVPSAYAASTVGQLIEALSWANANSGVANTIALAAPPSSPYVLDSALPAIAAGDDLTIVGNGDTIERSADAGTPAFQLFDVPVNASLTLQGLTLENGEAPTGEDGGAILNEGTLTVQDCAITGNSADAGSSGGGIANVGGTVSVVNSTIANNSTPEVGGGIFNSSGTALLANCTVSGNTAGGSGGGIEAQGNITVACSTFSLNSATYGGAIDNYYGNYAVSLVNTLLANNSASASGPDFQNGAISQGYNLVDNTAGSWGFGATGDLLNVSADLGLLSNNGGPTETMALLPGSPAIGAGDPNYLTDAASPLANDQRGSGFARVVNGRLDIGAFEVQQVPTFQVSSFPMAVNTGDTDSITVTALDADGSIDTSYSGTVSIRSSDPLAVLPDDAGLSNGTGQFQVILETPGTQSITATDTADSYVTGTESGIAVAPITFAVTGFPTVVNAGDTDTVTVTALAADGSIDTSYSGIVSITSSDPMAVLPLDAGLSNGTGQFQVILETPGVQSIMATDTVNGAITGTESGMLIAPYFVVTGFPAVVNVGDTDTVTVTALNADGSIDTSYSGTVSMTSSDPLAVLPQNAGLSNGIGQFQVTLETPGTQSITATDTADSSLTATESGIAVAPITIAVTGFPTAVNAGDTDTVTVTALDADGSIDTSYSGTVSITSSDPLAVLPQDAGLTNGIGQFQVTLETPGVQSITATDTVNGAITATESGILIAPYFVVSGFPTGVNAGDTDTVTVTAFNADGSIDTSDSGTVQITSSDPLAVLPDDAGLSNGTGQFQVTLETPGTQSITATDTADSGLTATESGIAVAPITFAVTGFPTAVNAGDTDTVTVTALDADGSIDTSYGGALYFTSSDPQAVLPYAAGLTNGTINGDVTFAAGQVGQAYDFPGDGSYVSLSGSASLSGARTIAAWVYISQANTGEGLPIFTAGSAYQGDFFGISGQTAPNSSNGVAPAEDYLYIDHLGTATYESTISITPDAWNQVAVTYNGSTISFYVNGQPAGAVNGSLYNYGIDTADIGGNTIGSSTTQSSFEGLIDELTVYNRALTPSEIAGIYGGTVSIATSDPLAVLPDDARLTLTNGTGQFQVALKTAGTQSITATDIVNGAITGTESGIAVAPLAFTQLAFLTSPTEDTSYEAGQPLGTVAVAITDSFGNIDTGDSDGSLGLTVSGPGGFDSHSLTTADVVNGTATFQDLDLDTAGRYTLGASAPGLEAATSGPFTVYPGPATSLAFVQAPNGGTAGKPLAPIHVVLLDKFGSIETDDDSDIVELTVSGPQGFTIDSTVSHGVATFSGLVLYGAGSYTLSASVVPQDFDYFTNGPPGATASPFTVAPGAPARLTFTQAPAGGATGQPLGPVQVSLTDDFGNVEARNAGSVSLSVSGSDGFAPGSITTADLVNGVATFDNLTLNTAGYYTLAASSPDVSQPDSVSLTITPMLATGATLATATPLFFTPAGTVQASGYLADADQFHIYSVALGGNDEIDVTAGGQAAGSGLSPLLRIFDAAGTQVALNNEEGGDPELKFQAATAGTYFIGVSCGLDDNYDPTTADSGAPGTTTGGLYVLSVRRTPGAAPQADLEAASIRLGTGTAVWGDSVPVTFSVENRGAADAGPFSVSVLIGSDQDVWYGPPFEPPPRQDLQDFPVPALAAGQAFSPGTFTVTLPDAATAANDGLPTSGSMFLELQIVPDGGTPQTESLVGTDHVHRGEDWEEFTILTPQAASGDNMSLDTADTLQDIDNQVSGSVAPGTEEWFQLSAPDGSLTATVAAAGGAASAPRLTLYAQDGTPLVSSDGQIVEHLDAGIYGSYSGTYYLGVAAQGDGGAYQLITQVVPGSSPLEPIPAQSDQWGEVGAADSVLLADESGDGRPDLIASTSAGLEVLPGNGDGTFGAPLTDDAGGPLDSAAAALVAVADLYGNGRLDVIAVDGAIVVLPADSDGGFQPSTTIAFTGQSPLALATADLTGGGFPDIVTLNTDGTLTVVLNNGDGTFQAPQQIDSGVSAVGFGQVLRFFAVSELTGNGIPDLIVPDADGTVHVLLGNGDGTFQPPLIVPVGADIGALAVADVNGDGRPDLVVTTSDPNGAAGKVRVLFGNGDGTFRPGALLTPGDAGGSLDSLAAADLNGDGHLDLLAAGSGTGVVFPGTADGSFGSAIPLAVAPGETSVDLADLNGDGRLDLVVGNDDGTIAVLPGNGDGTFQVPSPTVGADLDLQSQDMVDVTGDGHPDVVATGSLGVVLEAGNGDGTFQPARLLAPGQTLVAVTDLNGDGRPDLVLNGGIMLGNGNGTFQPLEPLPAGQSALAVGDFTGDGIPDLIVTDAAGDISFRRGNGDGTFQPAQPIEGVTGVTEAITAVLTGDGHLDLVVVATGTGEWGGYPMTVLLGNGDGTFRLGFTQPNDERNPSLLAVALHDGQPPDLLLGADFGQFDFVLDNDGAGNFSLDGGNSFENEWSDTSAVAAADFTGDGYQDLVFLDSGEGVRLAMGDGNGDLSDPLGNGDLSDLQEVAHDPNATSLAVADVNGDGRPDIILNDEVLLGNGDGTFRQAAPTGGITVQDTPHLADLTGDGRADSVVLDASGNILFRKGMPGGSFAPPVVLNPGQPAVDLTILNTGTGLAVAAAEATCDPAALAAHQWLYDVALYTVAADGTVARTIAFSSPLLPARIAAGDLTGSGLDDLIVADALDYKVTIAFQTAPGQFGSVISRSVGCAPSDIALVNVSGDGLPDIVVTDQGCDEVTALLNDASHSFTTEANYRAGTAASAVFPFAPQATYQAGTAASSSIVYSLGQAVSLAAGDFTGDGRNDLVVVNRAAHSFSLLVNDGNGGFADPQATLTTSTSDGLTVNEQPGAVVAGYFNGPGQPLDLAILMQDTGQVWIYTGDGHGHFSHTASILAGDSPTGLSLIPGSGPGLYDLLVGSSYGDVLRLVGNGNGSFSPPPPAIGDRVALDVTEQANGQLDALVADAATNQVTVQSPAAGGERFVPLQALTAADPADQLAPGAVQWAELDRNAPYYDAVVLGSASNDVLVYRCTGFDAAGQPTFAAPVAYPVGTDPVAVTIQDITGNGIPDMLVANYGSNDVSILFGSYDTHGDWVAREGPRLKSGGSGSVAVAVQDVPGGNPSLIITNGQSGNLSVLPGVGQGFFNDTDPQILNIPGNPAIGAALLLGSSGVVLTGDGRLVGFNLDDFAGTAATIFAPPPGEGVAAVAALAGGDLVAAKEDGTVVLLAASSGLGLQPVQTLAPLTGIPSDPSALAVLENASGVEVLVTSAGQDQLFVFGLPAGLTLPVLTPGSPVAVAKVPSEAPLALVVTLEGGVLPGGEVTLPAGVLVGAAPVAAPVGAEVISEGAGRLNIVVAVLTFLVDDGGDEPLQVRSGEDEPLTVPVREQESDFGLGIDELLRRIDLHGSPDQLPPRRATPPAVPRDGAGNGKGGEVAAPELPDEPTQHAVAETVKDAVRLDWTPLAASRPDQVGPDAGPLTPLRGKALLVVAAVTGLAVRAERHSERSRKTSGQSTPLPFGARGFN